MGNGTTPPCEQQLCKGIIKTANKNAEESTLEDIGTSFPTMNVLFLVNLTINCVPNTRGWNVRHPKHGTTKHARHVLEIDYSFTIFATDTSFESKLC